MKTLTQFLLEEFRTHYVGFDDNGPDMESKWFSELDGDELIELFQKYMRTNFEIHVGIEDHAESKMNALKFIYSLL